MHKILIVVTIAGSLIFGPQVTSALGFADHQSPNPISSLTKQSKKTVKLFDMTKASELGKHGNLKPIGQ